MPALIPLTVILFPFASALDANHNGISDVWEAAYPAEAAQLEADSDGDGQSNGDEGRAWTDPTDPDSFFRPRGLTTDGSNDHFTVEGQRWLRDAVVESGDLSEWTRDGDATASDGSNADVTRPADPAKKFYRVARYFALNSDTDALDNREEEELGTDPLTWDSDGDKVADDVEFRIGTDPLSSTDSDGDSLPDDWERWCIVFDAGDGVTDLTHVSATTDFDGDSILDGDEFALGTSPVVALKNIVFFLTEDQGPDLGCLGTVGLETPNLDTLGNGGVIFERAFALSPVCSPSKMALFTGTYPHTNSAHRNVPNYGVNFPLGEPDPSQLGLGGVHEDLPTLIEIFRDQGWHTSVSSKSHVQPVRKFPYHQGHSNPGTPAAATNIINNTVTAAGQRPFFLCFNMGAPHLPFRNTPNANGLWDPSGGLLGDGGVTNVDPSSIVVPNSMPDVPGVRQDWTDYYGAIEVVDSLFAAVRAALQAQGILDETLVVFSGDHGIGLHRFKQSIYGLQVPLLIDGPGVSGSRRLDAPVSHFDLAPTFLDFAGIAVPPSMGGKSLWPLLSGQSEFSDRKTILGACHEKYDARSVCDGRYYYVRNIRQASGATLANPGPALNADQFQGGSPWYNRAYDATVAATGTPQRELLRILVEGELPPEELYDLDADPWCSDNLISDPALAGVRKSLARELAEWRIATEDYNQSASEVTRREQRFISIDPPVAPTASDNFDGESGALDDDADWTLDIAGNSDADFTLGSGRVDAPAGPVTLATHDGSALTASAEFTVSVKTGFDGTGVAGGVAFGVVPDGGSSSFWQFMLADGRSAPGGSDKDVRLFRVVQGSQQNPALIAENGLPNYPTGSFTNGALFTVEVSGQQGSSLVDLRILDPDGSVYYFNSDFDLGAPVPEGGKFGITTWSSGSSIFDDFNLILE
ncbi:hypothetical protein HAHE_15430 [Haloferula helveola]|uniref:Sulfatase N-terminal domain-containing protein n=1 Tax=Haloferula helveola TaxID=490095 RepID=A0ABN6H202_9BACT|nr:hypothetical protein HAHE_15430 [Haloferula helveola]